MHEDMFKHLQTREEMKVLVYGRNGWIGGKMWDLLIQNEIECVAGKARLEHYGDVRRELMFHAPDRVICAAGLTGRPNIDWCESHREEVMRTNVIATTVLADYCSLYGVHLTYFGTGCIYEYDADHPMHCDVGFAEWESPNFSKSFYSKTKTLTEQVLKEYTNTLILRVRMPLSDDLHPRNFITKIVNYEKVVDVPNSMSVLAELLPIAVDMMRNSTTGVYNFTNPGTISHNEILDFYKIYIDPTFEYQNFTLKEQAKILLAGRSNNELDVSKLLTMYPAIEPIQVAIIKLFERMKDNLPIEV
uniref:NAD dependent epimerase/dehydratase n=1 Tax=Pithovirus LCPAC304 TaxID=2506594 RepID=A0A481ZAV3_9VIRU|nr:MAG: NAD dependent epimerase/dehydratase [Pithovirus LCPAC304]